MKNVAVLVAVGVRSEGHREILGVAEGTKEESQSWRTFLRYLNERRLEGVRLTTSEYLSAEPHLPSRGSLSFVVGQVLIRERKRTQDKGPRHDSAKERFWRDLIAGHAASGLSVRAWCLPHYRFPRQ